MQYSCPERMFKASRSFQKEYIPRTKVIRLRGLKIPWSSPPFPESQA